MQALFILSLFSLVFAMFSGMAAGLSKNIMQSNVEKIEEVRNMFHDVEIVLNKVVFKTRKSNGDPIVDLKDPQLTNLSGDFLPKYVGYTSKQLDTDPWNNKIFLLKYTQQTVIWGAKDQKAEAPVSTILLVSAGPNGRYDLFDSLGMDLTFDSGEIKKLTTEDISQEETVNDDIILRFNNYEAMLDIWERSENVDTMIKNVSLDYYKNLVDAFSPLIQLAQRDVTREGILKDNIFSEDSLIPDQTCLDAIPSGKKNDTVEQAKCYKNDYSAFTGLEDKNNKSLTNEWYDKDNPIYEVLEVYKNGAKPYDGNIVLSTDSNENAALNGAFKTKYSGVDFLYPTFDALEKDKDGNELAESEKGLKNLGLSNIESLDPFAGADGNRLPGQVWHEYDEEEPAKFKIIRQIDKSPGGWKIEKKIEIDALGGI